MDVCCQIIRTGLAMQINRLKSTYLRRLIRSFCAAWCLLPAITLTGCLCSSKPKVWDYHWSGSASNINGCEGQGDPWWADAYFSSLLRIHERTDDRIVVSVDDINRETTLLLAFHVHGGAAPGSWTCATNDASVRAWIVRIPQSVFNKELDTFQNGLGYRDEASLRALVDGKPVNDFVSTVFPMFGTAALEADSERVLRLTMDLNTVEAIPVYKAYYEYCERLESRAPGPNTPKRIAELDACSRHATLSRARVHGTMYGYWRCRIMLL